MVVAAATTAASMDILVMVTTVEIAGDKEADVSEMGWSHEVWVITQHLPPSGQTRAEIFHHSQYKKVRLV